ncbi:hypothetical protein [Noviherbaspirillum pedocola]|uniref:Uncharacterized protein n=1 Tax=Noviherbaspirillum pedocola TaxID=2801341 RepID=A0A934SYL1_9BURK|nr:hypothetical protein [Noviherbaspirillum pedocola]MBK4739246.1 hypothetical protein [Noviherbaspirillum pedocola]
MPSKTSEDLDNDVLLELIVEIQRIVEKRHGPQESADRVLDYTIHAALTMIDAVTSHEPAPERIKSFRSIVSLFSAIAETDYIQPIGDEPKQTRHQARDASP